MVTCSIRPGVRPHPEEHLPPFEGWAGRPGAGDHPFAVPEDDLEVCPDVDEERYLLLLSHPAGEDVGDDVPPDVVAHRREDEDRGRVPDRYPDPPGRGREVPADNGHVGLLDHVAGVDAHQDVGHDGVPGDHHLVDIVAVDAALVRGLRDRGVDAFDGEGLEGGKPPLPLREVHAGEDVLPAADLAVVGGADPDHIAGGEVPDVRDDRRRAEVDRDAEEASRGIALLEVDEAVRPGDQGYRRGDVPPAIPEDPGDAPDDLEGGVDLLDRRPPGLFDSPEEAGEVWRGVLERGGLERDRVLPDRGVELGRPPERLDEDLLRLDEARFGEEDLDVLVYERDAGEAVALLPLLGGEEPGQPCLVHGDLPVPNDAHALAALALPAADDVHLDPRGAGGVQDRAPAGDGHLAEAGEERDDGHISGATPSRGTPPPRLRPSGRPGLSSPSRPRSSR